MRGQLRIEQMYAFIVLDDDNTEGVPAMAGPGGIMMPLVAADLERVESLRPVAQSMAKRMGKRVTLARFEIRTDLETYQ